MGNYLVMKNNLIRLGKRKSTFLILLLIPLIIGLAGVLMKHSDKHTLSVGVIGSDSYYEEIRHIFEDEDRIQYEKASFSTIKTDSIMGKYQFIVQEGKEESVSAVLSALKSITPISKNGHEKNMLAMLFAVFISVAGYYMSGFIQDKKQGMIERFCFAGSKKGSYIGGFFLSTLAVTGIQIGVILLFWQFGISEIQLQPLQFVIVYVFMLMISNASAMIVTNVSKSEMQAGLIASSMAMFFLLLSGVFVPVAEMPDVLQKISYLSPIRWLLFLT